MPVVLVYRYFWKNKEGGLFVKYVSETEEGHKTFIEKLRENEDVVSCYREYCHEIKYDLLGYTENIKIEKKEEEKDEEVC